MTIQAINGFKDILPDSTGRWQFIEQRARSVFERFGLQEIRMPLMEKTELFVRSIGEATDVVEKEMYTFADKGITINAVAPGLVLVEATEYVPEHRHRLYIDQRALQREQGPEDVSGAVSYLLSDGARFVTGQVLPVNGGFVMN